MAGVIALFLALTGHVGDRLTEVMNSAFWISLFLTIVLLGWLCWFEKSVIEAVFAAQNFAVSRNWLGLSIFVFALIITAVLYLIELFARWRFDRIIAIVDEQVTAGALTDALASLLEAQRLNDRWMSSRALRLSVLHRLSAVYRQTNYRAGYVDVEHRIKAIESSPEFISLEQRIMKEVLKGYKPDPGRLKDYAVVCVFAVLLLLAVCWLPPFATGETPLK